MVGGMLTPAIESQYINVLDAKMHYRKIGKGQKTFVFLHGMPTSSYLWRHVMPHFSESATCYAPDFIGMGDSDKPDIDYTYEDHARYLTAFLDALNLDKITLIMHGWASVIGMRYVMDHPGKVAGLVFCEAHIRPMERWNMLALPVQELATFLKNEKQGLKAVLEDNYLIESLLPHFTLSSLSTDDMAAYRKPFQKQADRKPLWQYVKELPMGSPNSPVTQWVEEYTQWLSSSDIPKLILYAVPGFMTPISSVAWALGEWPAATAAELPDALHLAEESCPHLFVDAMTDWLNETDTDQMLGHVA